MRSIKSSRLLVVSLLLSGAVVANSAAAKENHEEVGQSIDAAVSYQAMYSNPVGGGANFWLQGGDAQAHGQFWRGLGAVADVAGFHNANVNGSSVGLDLITATFGPRYTRWLPRRPVSIYGQVLAGEAFGMHSLFPGLNGASSDSANGLAFVLGGGVNYTLRHRFSVRVFEADWVRTQLPNANNNVQNNLRLGAGLVLHIR